MHFKFHWALEYLTSVSFILYFIYLFILRNTFILGLFFVLFCFFFSSSSPHTRTCWGIWGKEWVTSLWRGALGCSAEWDLKEGFSPAGAAAAWLVSLSPVSELPVPPPTTPSLQRDCGQGRPYQTALCMHRPWAQQVLLEQVQSPWPGIPTGLPVPSLPCACP